MTYLNNDGFPTNHKPKDTGLGFTCDEGVFDLVMALNQCAEIVTLGSCEENSLEWLVPRSVVRFRANSPQRLLEFCCQIRDAMPPEQSWNQEIYVDNYYVPRGDVFAEISIPKCDQEFLLKVVQELGTGPTQEGKS